VTALDPALLARLDALVRERTGDDRLADMFGVCLRNTIERTARVLDDGSTFVITGDIPAMWLRDSTLQFHPYLLFIAEDRTLRELVTGLVQRQAELIIHDPYANAFNVEPNGATWDPDDLCDDPLVWEQKYEVDSLALPILLAHRVWRILDSPEHLSERVHRAFATVVEVWIREQHHDARSTYRFVRHNDHPGDTLVREGRGPEHAVTGMTWAGFRPSDDACTFSFNIPGNLLAAHTLDLLGELAIRVWRDDELSARAAVLAAEIRAGVAAHGIVEHPKYGTIFAYEVDGLGGVNLMDDANVPSLLSLSWLGAVPADDPVLQATRRFVLSEDNPYYFRGPAAAGVGSPHTPDRYVWPIALAVEGLTCGSKERREEILTTLRNTDAGTSMMHEGFDVDDPTRFTREWFSWANAMFCELVLAHCGLNVARLTGDAADV